MQRLNETWTILARFFVPCLLIVEWIHVHKTELKQNHVLFWNSISKLWTRNVQSAVNVIRDSLKIMFTFKSRVYPSHCTRVVIGSDHYLVCTTFKWRLRNQPKGKKEIMVHVHVKLPSWKMETSSRHVA